MISPINNIARSATTKQSLNILYFVSDDYFDSTLCNALPQHNFYAPINDHNRPNDWNFSLYPQPDNLYYIANFHTNNIISKINFDLIICHDRTTQYDIAKQLANILHINVVIIEHIANTEYLDLIGMIPLLKKTKNDINVFVEDIQEQFKINGTVIKYGISDLYQNNKTDQICIFDVESTILDGIKQHITKPIITDNTKTISADQYHDTLKNSKFYFNLSAETTRIQPSVLHAMSAGCIVVSMSSPIINNLITHMETGIIFQNMEELIQLWHNIDNSTGADTTKIAKNANQYIVDNYNPEKFRQKWSTLLINTSNKTYIR